ncbi:Aldolase-II domain-containing protein [Mycena sanguinolenta]|uniref:Aldolase-II domain-containing protein n=1 Tax=Mycena sanguinolenta TaxID=230812 RepID=A0A8H6Z524_9AGAR|nr:Aldolase-II domain-containing protein [Mycena sanguinolenta]
MSQVDSDAEYTQCLRDLSLASRILAHHGIVDGFGHVSCRDPRSPKEHFLLSRNLAPALVKSEDIVTWRISDAEPVDPNSPRGFLERCIHSEIYRQFEDVEAVVHFHSLDIIPFGLTSSIPFKAAYHMASFLGSDPAPIFDISDSFGPSTDMLIRNTNQGAVLASSFSPSSPSSPTRPLVLMRGHGATLTAASLKLAIFRTIYTQNNAKILTSLSSLAGGAQNCQGVRFLGAEECEASAASNSGQVSRAWDVWCKDLQDQS